MEPLGSGHGVLFQEGQVLPWYAERHGNTVRVWLRGRTWEVPLATDAAQSLAATQSGGDVTAPMPGSIVKVLVAEGDAVKAQQPLVIMESMKMELTVSAPVDGKVVKVSCQAGQLVDMNAVLASVEE